MPRAARSAAPLNPPLAGGSKPHSGFGAGSRRRGSMPAERTLRLSPKLTPPRKRDSRVFDPPARGGFRLSELPNRSGSSAGGRLDFGLDLQIGADRFGIDTKEVSFLKSRSLPPKIRSAFLVSSPAAFRAVPRARPGSRYIASRRAERPAGADRRGSHRPGRDSARS